MLAIRRARSSTTTGARPSDSSSISSNSGLQTMALPNASIWRSPPDSSPAIRERSGASAGKNWNTNCFEMAPLGRVGALRGCDGEVLGDRQVGKHLVALRHQHDAARGVGVRRLVLDRLARRNGCGRR